MAYLITVILSVILIAALNFWMDGIYLASAFFAWIPEILLGVAAVFVIDAFFAFVIRRLPERWFSPDGRLFSVGKREKSFYRKTGINGWKRYVPEWGCFTGFHKDQLQSSNDSAYLGRFLLESNYGVAGHVAGAMFGFLIMLLPFLRPFSVALPIAAVNLILSLLPTMVLRFNTYALRRLYQRALAREADARTVKPKTSESRLGK